MTDSILCDGCLMFEVVEPFTEMLQIVNLDDNTDTTHLCTDCTKKFWKWIKTIEERTQ